MTPHLMEVEELEVPDRAILGNILRNLMLLSLLLAFLSASSSAYINHSYTYSNSSFDGALGYKIVVVDQAGNKVVTPAKTLQTNDRPVVEDAELLWQYNPNFEDGSGSGGRGGGDGVANKEEAVLKYSDPNGNDIKTVEGSDTSTNSTAKVIGWGRSLNWNAEPTDFLDLSSDPYNISADAEVVRVYAEDDGDTVNESSQLVNTTMKLDVLGDPVKVEMDHDTPDDLISTVEDGYINTSSAASGTVTATWQFARDSVSENLYSVMQNSNKESSAGSQHILKNKEVSNTGTTNYSHLTVFSPSENSSLFEYSDRNVSLKTGNVKNVSYTSTADFIQEHNHDFSIGSPVVLGNQYTGVRELELSETGGIDFSNVSTVSAVTAPNKCSQANNSQVDIGPVETKNVSVGFNCDPGTPGNPIISKQLDADSNNDTHYTYDTSDLTINSKETESVPVKWKIDKDELNDWIDRKSATAYLDGDPTNVSVSSGAEYATVTFGINSGNSSPAVGEHNASLFYEVGEGDTTIIERGGGGGLGGGTDEEENETDTDFTVDFTTQERYTVAPGSSSQIYFTAWNYAKDENTVRMKAPDITACSYFTVQSSFVGDEFSKSSSLTLSGTRQQLGGGGSDTVLMAKVQLPNRTELQNKGLGDTFTCEFETGSGIGEAGPLNLTVQAVDTTPRWVKGVRQLVPEIPSTSLFETREICLPNGGESASRLEQVQRFVEEGRCSGSLHSIPRPTGEASALILGGFVLVAGVTRFGGKVI